MQRDLFDEEHDLFRETVREFLAREVVPNHDRWEKDGIVPREVWKKAGEIGMFGFGVPEEFGGAGITDFRYNAVIVEEIIRIGASGLGFSLHNDVMAPYFVEMTNDEQKARWLPGFAAGELITAVAMTEPGRAATCRGSGPPPAGRATTTSSTARRPSSPTASTPTWSWSWPRPTRSRAPGAPRSWSSSAARRASPGAATSRRSA
nr:hypothetical protein GCM10020093_086910 [Planobispora longispora]